MPYLDFHSTTPTTDLVDPVVSLNNNWDIVDSKFAALNCGSNPVGTGIVNPEAGMECTAPGISDMGVYSGSAWRAVTVSDTWGAWTNITLPANYTSVTGRTAQLRLSATSKKVQARGAIQYQGGTVAWPTGYQLISSAQFAASSYAPSLIGVRSLAATLTGTTTWAMGHAFLTSSGSFFNLYLAYLGTTVASGNYVSLDNLEWFSD
jgi:hypothetical protein